MIRDIPGCETVLHATCAPRLRTRGSNVESSFVLDIPAVQTNAASLPRCLLVPKRRSVVHEKPPEA